MAQQIPISSGLVWFGFKSFPRITAAYQWHLPASLALNKFRLSPALTPAPWSLFLYWSTLLMLICLSLERQALADVSGRGKKDTAQSMV